MAPSSMEISELLTTAELAPSYTNAAGSLLPTGFA
jgi:hypothetical protein